MYQELDGAMGIEAFREFTDKVPSLSSFQERATINDQQKSLG